MSDRHLSQQPRLVLLGTVVGNVLTSATLTATASAASGTLDIDFLIVVNLRDETVAIVANDDISLANLVTTGAATLFMGFTPTSTARPRCTPAALAAPCLPATVARCRSKRLARTCTRSGQRRTGSIGALRIPATRS
jgi:hypothetical protein